MKFRREQEDIYLALVADLAHTIIPTSIMGITLVLMTLFVWWQTADFLFLVVAFVGGVASLFKVVLMVAQRARNKCKKMSQADAARWEFLHAIATVVVATSVGTVVFTGFVREKNDIQILMTALLFGYCAGIVARTAIRPNIAILALILAAGPAILGASQAQTTTYHALALMFLIFMLGAFDTVRHVHMSAVRHIGTSLEMASLARNDALTGLANRLAIREAFRTTSSFSSDLVAVHYLDLDGFKGVNDKFGHAGGDAILVEVAQRLLALAPQHAIVARFGGDEFVVFQMNVTVSDEAESLARRIVNTLNQPFSIKNQIVEVGASLGFSIGSTEDGLDKLLHLADEASYEIKRNGGGAALGSSASH